MATVEAETSVGVPGQRPLGRQLVRLLTTTDHKTIGKRTGARPPVREQFHEARSLPGPELAGDAQPGQFLVGFHPRDRAVRQVEHVVVHARCDAHSAARGAVYEDGPVVSAVIRFALQRSGQGCVVARVVGSPGRGPGLPAGRAGSRGRGRRPAVRPRTGRQPACARERHQPSRGDAEPRARSAAPASESPLCRLTTRPRQQS